MRPAAALKEIPQFKRCEMQRRAIQNAIREPMSRRRGARGLVDHRALSSEELRDSAMSPTAPGMFLAPEAIDEQEGGDGECGDESQTTPGAATRRRTTP